MDSNHPAGTDAVTVGDWNACYNGNDNVIVASCTVTSADQAASITGVGLIVNDVNGHTLASFYTSSSSGSQSVYPAFNLPPGHIAVGDTIAVVVQGECDGKHFFVEQDLTVSHC
jgi:hypothetical protein